MIADRRRYTKAQKDAYRARVANRRRSPRVWLNGRDITDLLKDFKLDAWQSYALNEVLAHPERRFNFYPPRGGLIMHHTEGRKS